MKFNLKSATLALLVLCMVATLIRAETATQHIARLAWWRDARFGMFIHWGPVSLTGQEISWSRANSNTNCPNNGPIPVKVYDNLYKSFDPTNFNAREWVDIAKSAGMKYMVLTAKHGDGFLLWDSKVDGYNIGASPFHRDVCAELAGRQTTKTKKSAGIFRRWTGVIPTAARQTTTDSSKKTRLNCASCFPITAKSPCCGSTATAGPPCGIRPRLIRSCADCSRKFSSTTGCEISTTEQWLHQGQFNPNEDFYTPEQRIGAYDDQTPWETCMTLGTQWSWKPDDKIKSARRGDSHSRPMCRRRWKPFAGCRPEDRTAHIEPRQVEVLKQVGAWLDKNGESIYGTRGGPWKPTKAIASTRKANLIYLHILNER